MQYITNKGEYPYGLNAKTVYEVTMPTNKKSDKPALSYLFTCANAIQDKLSGRWSYIDSFDGVTIPTGLEFYIQSYYVIGKINRVKPGENITEVQVIDPDGVLFANVKLSGTLVEGDVTFAAFFLANRFEKTGRYYLRALQNGQRLADGERHYFTVEKQKDE